LRENDENSLCQFFVALLPLSVMSRPFGGLPLIVPRARKMLSSMHHGPSSPFDVGSKSMSWSVPPRAQQSRIVMWLDNRCATMTAR
jgi:hypothetical protein